MIKFISTHGREWTYKDVKPLIIVEQYVKETGNINDVVKGLVFYYVMY